MAQSIDKRYWGIRLGGGGGYVPWARRNGYVAIGWVELGDISWLLDSAVEDEELWKNLRRHCSDVYGYSEAQNSIACGVLWKFVKEMKQKDIILIPDIQMRSVLVSEISGDYEYKNDWKDDCRYTRRRKFTLLKEMGRDDLPQKLKSSLGCSQTVFNLDARKGEIENILGISPAKEVAIEKTGKELVGAVIDKLFDLDPRSFENFIAHVLSLVGFQAAATEYVADKGIDVIGTLNAEGLADIVLKIQVKRVKNSIGIDEVQRTRGVLGTDEHGAYITLSSFTKDATKEAQAEKKKPIALVDGKSLVDLILKHYDDLEEKYKQLLPLKKKEVPLEDHFVFTGKCV